MSIYQKIEGTATDSSGNTVASATIYVYLARTASKATIYSDNAGSFTKSNPFSSDAVGAWFFYAPRGEYTIHIQAGDRAYNLLDQQTLTSDELADPANTWDSPLEDRLRLIEAQIAELFEMVTGDTIAEPPG